MEKLWQSVGVLASLTADHRYTKGMGLGSFFRSIPAFLTVLSLVSTNQAFSAITVHTPPPPVAAAPTTTPAPASVPAHATPAAVDLGGGPVTTRELLSAEQEKVRLAEFSADLMKEFGCQQFERKGFRALLKYLRGAEKSKLTERQHLTSLASHLFFINHTDIPASKIRSENTAFTQKLHDLSELMRKDVFEFYDDGDYGSDGAYNSKAMTGLDVANNLQLEEPGSDETPKKKIMAVLHDLAAMAGEDRTNMSCHGVGGKNEVVVSTDKGYMRVAAFQQMKKTAAGSVHLIKPASQPQTATERPTVRETVVRERPVAPQTSAVVPSPTGASVASSSPSASGGHQLPTASVPKVKPTVKPTASDDAAAPRAGDHKAIIKKYLGMSQEQAKKYMTKGWRPDYDDFIEAFVAEKHRGLLKNFNVFAEVCDLVPSYRTEAQKLDFLKKFMRVLSNTESEHGPRIETRESKIKKHRPNYDSAPKVAGIPYIQHSSGLYQLDETDRFSNDCEEIDYENDVAIGYPSTRTLYAKDKHGIHDAYLGDDNRTILNPFVNTACAIRILEHKIKSGLYSNTQYWSCFRTESNFKYQRGKFSKAIKAAIPGC